MGKASSAKKVARAARAGGSTKRERPKIGFPIAVFLVVLLGASMVVFARTSREPASAAPPSYLNSDHWHAAYGAYVCDTFLPSWIDAIEDRSGIHTHSDGIIHIHPFSASASGTRAKMSVFAEQVGVTFTDDGFIGPDGTEYTDGYDCGGQPAVVSIFKWFPDDPTRPGEVYEENFDNIVFDSDRAAYTIAVAPEGVTPPLPPSVPTLDNLTDMPSSGAGGIDPSQLGLDPSQLDPSQLDPSQLGVDPSELGIDPATGEVAPVDPGIVTGPPVSDGSEVTGDGSPPAAP